MNEWRVRFGDWLIHQGRQQIVKHVGPRPPKDAFCVRILDFDRAHVWLVGYVKGTIPGLPSIPSTAEIQAMINERVPYDYPR